MGDRGHSDLTNPGRTVGARRREKEKAPASFSTSSCLASREAAAAAAVLHSFDSNSTFARIPSFPLHFLRFLYPTQVTDHPTLQWSEPSIPSFRAERPTVCATRPDLDRPATIPYRTIPTVPDTYDHYHVTLRSSQRGQRHFAARRFQSLALLKDRQFQTSDRASHRLNNRGDSRPG